MVKVPTSAYREQTSSAMYSKYRFSLSTKLCPLIIHDLQLDVGLISLSGCTRDRPGSNIRSEMEPASKKTVKEAIAGHQYSNIKIGGQAHAGDAYSSDWSGGATGASHTVSMISSR